MLIILIVNIIIRLSYLFPPWTIDVVTENDIVISNIMMEGNYIVTEKRIILRWRRRMLLRQKRRIIIL